jgi:arsenate reductase
MKYYHNPRCSKSRIGLQLLQDRNIDVEVVEYLKDVPTINELQELIKLMGISPENLLRKGEQAYKDNLKGKNLSDQEILEAMVRFPKLIERPILISSNKAVIGRPPEKVLTIL